MSDKTTRLAPGVRNRLNAELRRRLWALYDAAKMVSERSDGDRHDAHGTEPENRTTGTLLELRSRHGAPNRGNRS